MTCTHIKSRVLETRGHHRRRECTECAAQFWTEEVVIADPGVWKKKKRAPKPSLIKAYKSAVPGFVIIDGKQIKIIDEVG